MASKNIKKSHKTSKPTRYIDSSSHLAPTTVLTIKTKSFNDMLSAIDWKESYVSLSLGILVVAVIVSFVLVFAKGKSMNFVTDIHTKSSHTLAKVAPEKTILSAKTYTVQDGDDLADIAYKIYGNEDDWAKIAQANNLDNPDSIVAGQVLQIPK